MNMKKHILYFIAAVTVISMMVVACEKDIAEPTQSTTTDTTPSTPDLPDTPDTNSAPDTTLPAPMLPDFVGLDEWLVNSTWVTQTQYTVYISDSYSWRRFRTEYNPQAYTWEPPLIADTFYFDGDSMLRIHGRYDDSCTYGLRADSVGVAAWMWLYQISADSMIVYNWQSGFTAVVESWLFTKMQ